jgi:hypothetical protein
MGTTGSDVAVPEHMAWVWVGRLLYICKAVCGMGTTGSDVAVPEHMA